MDRLDLFIKRRCTRSKVSKEILADLYKEYTLFSKEVKFVLTGPVIYEHFRIALEEKGYQLSVEVVSGLKLKTGLFESKAKWKERYGDYLASREWWEKRQAVMKRAKGICERCKKKKAVAVHHLTYARIFKERLTDLQAICQPCHEYLHAR